jgi:hypothetical protein
MQLNLKYGNIAAQNSTFLKEPNNNNFWGWGALRSGWCNGLEVGNSPVGYLTKGQHNAGQVGREGQRPHGLMTTRWVDQSSPSFPAKSRGFF